MPRFAFETLDVFSERAFAGNPLAVVGDARGLSIAHMQCIAREFNLSESTFVLPPENPSNTARVRIFTPGYEMPFAGHPTIGTAIAIARARNLQGELRLELNTGVFPVRVDLERSVPFAEFRNPNLPTENGDAPDVSMLERAVSLDPGTIDRGTYRPRRVGAGVDYIFVKAPLVAIQSAKLNSSAFEALQLEETVGVVLLSSGGVNGDATYHVRMFAPNAGVSEDPATGSAAAALPGYIALCESIADGVHPWVIEQGIEMGRPSRLQVTVEIAQRTVQSVRVGGHAVSVMRGELEVI